VTTVVRSSATTQISRAPERRRVIAVALSAVASGVLLAVVWSYEFVDSTIGNTVANSVLGYDAKTTAIAGVFTGAVFGLVSGLAGTFTACNIAVFGVLPEVSGQSRGQLRAVLTLLGWLSAGILTVSAGYGAVAVLIGRSLPQLSTATTDAGMPVRLIQASVTFGLIGLAFGYLGLLALGFLRDPFARHPRARLVVLGALIGGFLVGRPYPLFHKLLEYAVDQHNPLYGALTFILQSIGNILVMGVLALLLAVAMRGRLGRRMARPGNAALSVGFALLLLGTFLVVYWDVRLPALFGYGWFPSVPWNT
jgi:hypothetical protein